MTRRIPFNFVAPLAAICALVVIALSSDIQLWATEVPADANQPSAPVQSAPTGDEHVKSLWQFEIASEAPFCVDAALASDEGIYLAGHAWTKATGQSLWLWRIDRSGTKQWERSLALEKRNEGLEIVGLLSNRRVIEAARESAGGGVSAVIEQGTETRLQSFTADGKIVAERALASHDATGGVIAFENGDLLLFGMDMYDLRKQRHAWAARTDREGKVTWRLALDPQPAAEKRAPASPKPLPGGVQHLDQLHTAVLLGDGSAVLVGQTGVYSKFGQGPSKLWLVRVSGEGQKLAEALVDDGRTYGGTRDLVAKHEAGVVVSYTTAQLPPIAGAPYNNPPSFANRLACFNPELDKLWEQPLPNSGMPGAVAICGPVPYLSLSAEIRKVVVRAADASGNELWRSVVETTKSSVFPVAVMRLDNDVVAVCNYQAHPAGPSDRPRPQVMVITVAPPAR